MTDNFSVDRSHINYIHARNYFKDGEIESLRPLVDDVSWVEKKYGMEMEHFNLIYPDIDLVLGKMVGDIITIDKKASGTLRKPIPDVVRFEDFSDLNDWRFITALDENEFITYNHIEGYKTLIEYIKDDSEEKPQIDFTNMDEWEIETVIKLKPNDVLFYRPWVFHSFNEGVLHYYKLIVS